MLTAVTGLDVVKCIVGYLTNSSSHKSDLTHDKMGSASKVT